MNPRAKNKLGKEFVAKRIAEEISLEGDTLRIVPPSTKSTPELLVTSVHRKKTALLRIQYSQFYEQEFDCHSSGWHVVFRHVLENSKADFFVFVCASGEEETTAKTCDYYIIKTSDLRKRLLPKDTKRKKFYLYLTAIKMPIKNVAVDVRGIDRSLGENQGQKKIPKGIQEVINGENPDNNYTEYLDNWTSIKEFLEKEVIE